MWLTPNNVTHRANLYYNTQRCEYDYIWPYGTMFFTLIKIKIILKSHQKHILSEGVIIGRFYAT